MPPDGTKTIANNDLAKILKKLKESPIPTENCQDDFLMPILNTLMARRRADDGALHWFCKDAEEATREAATFLLRLFAYSNDVVSKWKAKLLECLHSCPGCVQSLDRVKVTSRST